LLASHRQAADRQQAGSYKNPAWPCPWRAP